MTTVNKLLLLLAVQAFAIMAAPCLAAGLRGEVLLDKDVVTIGDIFSDAGDISTKVLGPAPAPGQKISYDVMALAQVAKNHGVTWQPASNYDKVTITRASQVINAEMVKSRVEAEITAHTNEKDLDIALDNANLEIHRAKGDPLNWRIADLSYDPARRRFSGNLVIETKPGDNASVTPIAGRAMPMVSVAVLARALPPGTRLSESAVDWEQMPIDKSGADAITSVEQLKGAETKRALEAKAILRLRDTTKARLVVKGSMVTMQVNTSSMQIAVQGRALGDAVMGETVRVMNTQSNRTVDAIVTGESKVSVSLPSNHLVSAE
jgi:flagella basal body P-ring formation protein FlgA